MDCIHLSDNTARQVIDSTTVFEEFRRVRDQVRPHSGGMYWKRQGEYEYLVKTWPDNRQQRIGPRSPQTETTYADFTSRKASLESRLRSLREALTESERLNKALKAGRVPSMVVSVLQTLEAAGLGEHFTVVGTHALYAYETAAGVRIVQGALATQDIDLLRDARKRVRFLTDLGKLDSSLLRVLQKADATFQRKDAQLETAINAKGFEVDFLQAVGASVLTNAPRFEHAVISATGRMALMRTMAPAAFIEFKRWMAVHAQTRPEAKRRRDLRQADIVQELVDDGLLLP